MGCCTSNFAQHRNAVNIGINDEAYLPAGQHLSSKRTYSSRISAGSSGVFSHCSTPSRRSILSRCSTPSRTPTPKPKPNTVNYRDCHKKQNIPNAFNMLSICDDFGDAQVLKEQQQDMDNSYGYFSASISTPANSNNSSPASTPSKSRVRSEQNISKSLALDSTLPPTQPPSNLEMEMYMMSHAENFMPKTSSPIFYRRDITFDVPPTASPASASASYEKWRNYLQQTPAYMLNNITRIPEAIAGQFCPASFPGFSDLEDIESAAKRYKVDTQQHSPQTVQVPHIRTTITTEL